MLDQGDPRVGGDRVAQRPLHLGAGGVAAGVHDPVGGVPALAGEQQLPVAVAVEGGAPADQLAQPRRPLGDQHPDGRRVAQADAGDLGVAGVRRRGVGRGEHGGDAALRPAGRAVVDLDLGDDGDRQPRRAGVQRHAQPGDAGADDADVGGQLPPGRRRPQPQRQPGGHRRDVITGPVRRVAALLVGRAGHRRGPPKRGHLKASRARPRCKEARRNPAAIVGPSCSEPLIARAIIDARITARMKSKAVFFARKRLSANRTMISVAKKINTARSATCRIVRREASTPTPNAERKSFIIQMNRRRMRV